MFYRPDEGETHYKLTVAARDGRPAPPTAYSRGLASSLTVAVCSAGCGSRIIPPRGSFRDQIIVTKLYDLTIPGVYILQISAQWGTLPRVASNQLRITVVPSGNWQR